MSAPAAIATHGAGRVEPTRLGVRSSEPTAPAPLESSAPELVDFAAGTLRVGDFELEVAVQTAGAVAHLEVAVRNASSRPLRLESVLLGFRWLGCGEQGMRFLRHGWQSWSFSGARALDAAGEPEFPSGPWLRGLHHALGAVPADRAGWHESHLVTVAGASTAGPCCLVGAFERGSAFAVAYLRRDAEAGALQIELEQCVDAELAPGQRLELERMRVALGADSSELLEAFADAHGALAGARSASPFVAGWCSWYHYFHDVTESDVLRNLEALVASRDALPVEVVQLDDGYQRAVGDWLETNEKFPRGLAALAGEIRAAGFVAGLWTAPFCAVAESAVFRDHREWLLRSGDGLQRALVHPQWARDGAVYALDPSRPEVVTHLEALFAELVEMGFGYLKLDFLYAAALRAEGADPGLGRAARLRRGLEAIRHGAGEEAFLLGCGCPLGAAVGVVDGMRVGPDVAPHWLADASSAVPGIEASLPSTHSALRSILARAWTHRRLWLADPDCLMARADSQLRPEEVRTLAAVCAASGGMLLFSDDVAQLGDERRALVGETLRAARAVDGIGLPGAPRALGLLDAELAAGLVARDGEGASVALVNGGDAPLRAEFDAKVVGRLQGPPQPLLGTRAPDGGDAGTLAWTLAPHETAFVRLVRQLRLGVFCDFDGTFSVQDVGATLAKRHAGERRPLVWERYERGEITAWEYNMEVLDGLALPRTQVEEFLRSVELDAGARDLLAWCEDADVPFRVLSDGFDANLLYLQRHHRVRFAFDANQLRYERGRWRLRPGHPDPACPCGTGTCKRGRIDAFRVEHPGVPVVHIGNGRVSDLCGALAADLAFAKDSLAVELEERGEAFERFETLRDVIPALAKLLG